MAAHTRVESNLQRLEKLAHEAVRDLHDPQPLVFWTDLIASATAGYGALALALAAPFGSPAHVVGTVVAALLLYRALCFMHEIAHVRSGALRGFETAWNVLVGIPLLMPSFIYTHGVHRNHHALSTYGTPQDPEYLPFASSHVMTIVFAAHSVLLPLALALRFLVLGPIALMVPAWHRTLVERASALAMHPHFRRAATDELLRKAWRWQAGILLAGGAVLAAVLVGLVPRHALLTYFLMMALVSVVNVLRTLGAHHYESDGAPMDRQAQLLDSIETPGHWWTELWAPVGLRYHALHHYFPGIPYHRLPEAHRRLRAALPEAAAFHQTVSPGLPSSLRRLVSTGWQRQRAQ